MIISAKALTALRALAETKDYPEGSTWYRLTRNQLADQSEVRTAEIMIYDEIGFYGIATSDLVKEIRDLDVDEIDVHLNTPGGDAMDGFAIYNTLKQHPARVVTVVDGMAASAGSFIAMAGDEVRMAKHSTLMIHDAYGMTLGDSREHIKTAEVLNKLSDEIASIYAEQAGGSTASWRARMREESWFTATEAVKAGLVDNIVEDGDTVPRAQGPAFRAMVDRAIQEAMQSDPLARLEADVAAYMAEPANAGRKTEVSAARVAEVRAQVAEFLAMADAVTLEGRAPADMHDVIRRQYAEYLSPEDRVADLRRQIADFLEV